MQLCSCCSRHDDKAQQETHGSPVPLLNLCTQLLHRDQAADTDDEVVDKLIAGLSIKQSPNNLWGLGRVDLLDITLNVAEHIVGVQIVGQVPNHVKAVTDIDKRPASKWWMPKS